MKSMGCLCDGDCFSYALAEVSGQPLLYKGNDFVRTGCVRCSVVDKELLLLRKDECFVMYFMGI